MLKLFKSIIVITIQVSVADRYSIKTKGPNIAIFLTHFCSSGLLSVGRTSSVTAYSTPAASPKLPYTSSSHPQTERLRRPKQQHQPPVRGSRPGTLL